MSLKYSSGPWLDCTFEGEVLSSPQNSPRIQKLCAFCSSVNMPVSKESVKSILDWSIEFLMAAVLNGKVNRYCQEYTKSCKYMATNFVELTFEQSYFRVSELVSDVDLPGFREDLVSYGLSKKQFLNEIYGILRDLAASQDFFDECDFNTEEQFRSVKCSPASFPRKLSPLTRRRTSVLDFATRNVESTLN